MKNRAQYILIFVSIVISVLLLIGIWSSKKTASTELYGCISMEKEDVKTFLSDNKLTDKDGTGIYLSKALMVTLNDEGRIDTLTVLAPGYTFCGIEVGDTYNHSVDSRKLSNNKYQLIEKNNLREVVYCRADGNEERDQIIWLSTDTYGIVTQITFSRTGAQAYISYAAGEMQYEQTAPDTDSTEMALYEYTEEETVANEYRTMSETETWESEFVFPYSDIDIIPDYELICATDEQLRIGKNEIYANHGRMFKDQELQRYFNSCSWYTPSVRPEDFNESVFNQTEKDNIMRIQAEIDRRAASN